MTICRRKGTTPRAVTFQAIVDDYIRTHREGAHRILHFYAIQKNLGEALDIAAFALLPGRKRHPHQYRIPSKALSQVQIRLRSINFSGIKNFHELHKNVASAIEDIPGVGKLMVYDTAHRIGAYLKLEPEYVYLHAGTREGAQALGFSSSRDHLKMQELPREFLQLRPHEIEDCLCIYKGKLKELGNK